MSPLCLSEGVGLIPWSPLARGFLAGNRKKGGGGSTSRAKNDPFADETYFRQNDFEIVDRVITLANQLGVNPAQIALSWLLHKPAVSAPIVGVSQLAHLEDAVKSLDIKLDTAQMTMLEEPYQPHPVLGHE
jgi:aryl-alcohol dehydrogenase (NADP+)